MSQMDLFTVTTQYNKHKTIRRSMLPMVMCDCGSIMMIVGNRSDVYGLICPKCVIKAFAIREDIRSNYEQSSTK